MVASKKSIAALVRRAGDCMSHPSEIPANLKDMDPQSSLLDRDHIATIFESDVHPFVFPTLVLVGSFGLSAWKTLSPGSGIRARCSAS